jgi:nitrogen fixation protein NifU and related proteins
MAGLEDLYREIILDHYRSPRNRGELEPPAIMAEGFNPLCGDEIKVFLMVEDDKVSDIRISGQGCSISQSSASMMSQAVKGKTVNEARAVIRAFKAMMTPPAPEHEAELDADPDHDHHEPQVKLGDLEALSGVQKFPVRIKCATLAWNTLTQAMDDAS